MTHEKTVLDIQFEEYMTGSVYTIDTPYEDAEIIPGKGVIFRNYNEAHTIVTETEILSWHSFDRLRMRRIPREEFDRNMAEAKAEAEKESPL